MILGVIGLGLIGGSMAIDLKKSGFCSRVIGVDNNADHVIKALKLGIIDEASNLEMLVKQSEVIIVAVPVDATLDLLPDLMNMLSDQVVMDVGSTKSNICNSIKNHTKRANFIAAHPMAGTEFSGPEAAISGMFNRKAAIICEIEKSSKRAKSIVEKLYKTLNMRTIYMDAESHDVHAAYVSHISHISSFALALTVLEQEENEKNIFDLASGGFDSTVRLAKSSAAMWAPILADNSENISKVLQTYIDRLTDFKKDIENRALREIHHDIKRANKISKVLSKETKPAAERLTKQDWNNLNNN